MLAKLHIVRLIFGRTNSAHVLSVAIHSTCDLQAEIMQLNPTMRFIPDANPLVQARAHYYSTTTQLSDDMQFLFEM